MLKHSIFMTRIPDILTRRWIILYEYNYKQMYV